MNIIITFVILGVLSENQNDSKIFSKTTTSAMQLHNVHLICSTIYKTINVCQRNV